MLTFTTADTSVVRTIFLEGTQTGRGWNLANWNLKFIWKMVRGDFVFENLPTTGDTGTMELG